MALDYNVTEDKIKRVIIDTDAACEADDPFAIAHALMSKKLEVKAILATHFGWRGSADRSYDEIMTILDAMDLDVPVFMGEPVRLAELDEHSLSPASQFIIEEAMREEKKPLFVLCQGAITNVATAIRKCPEITKKMTVVWIGGFDPDLCVRGAYEFNCANDVDAANFVMSSGVEFWQIPNNVYGTMHIGLAEIQRRIAPCGKIGKHLFENMTAYNESECAGWTAGESWSLGDSPAVGVVLEPNCGSYYYREAPIYEPDTFCRSESGSGRPMIRIYRSINSRFIIEDFIAKLEILYGDKG
ncbi:MAG: nucleoside hydrolase [Clostridiales bacterium]|nr:nucleoside hydrolase [Clostridiales bacterium]